MFTYKILATYQPTLLLTHFAHSKLGIVTTGFDTRLAIRPFLVFDFRALLALNPERHALALHHGGQNSWHRYE